MALSAQTASAIAKKLDSSGYHVAAGLSEATLNDFLNAHWKSEKASSSSVYVGDGKADELGISWHYEVRSPATIDLMPINPKTFSRIYRSFLATIPEVARHISAQRTAGAEPFETGLLGDNPPPNVQVKVGNLFARITPASGQYVDFEYSITITGIIETSTVNGVSVLRITPISAKVDDPSAVQATLRDHFISKATSTTDCVALEKLITYILNVLLANRIGSFIRQFDLPVPIRIVDGVAISSISVDIEDDQLVMMGYLGKPSPATKLREIVDLESAGPERTKQLTADVVRHAASSNSRMKLFNESAKSQSVVSWPSRGVFIIIHERFFQAISATLNESINHESGGSVFGVNYSLSYGFSIGNAEAKVINTGLDLAADVDAHAGARAWIPTHCGDAASASINADASGRARFAAAFGFDGREMFLTASPRPFKLNWNFGGLPWPINKIVGFLLDILSDVLIALCAAFGLKFKTKLTDLPQKFPGTNLDYNIALDPSVIKDPSQPALMILGEVDFLP